MFFSLILFFIYDFTVDFVFEYEMFPDSGLFEKEKAAAGYATANKYLISFFYRQTGANRGNITYSALTILLNAIAIFITSLSAFDPFKSATTSSTGGLILALKRAFLLLAQKGGIASAFTGPL